MGVVALIILFVLTAMKNRLRDREGWMEDLIDGKRRIEAVVCRDENGPGEASFLFDRNGCLLDFRGAVPCSEAFADMLSGICRNKPLVSGREYVEAMGRAGLTMSVSTGTSI